MEKNFLSKRLQKPPDLEISEDQETPVPRFVHPGQGLSFNNGRLSLFDTYTSSRQAISRPGSARAPLDRLESLSGMVASKQHNKYLGSHKSKHAMASGSGRGDFLRTMSTANDGGRSRCTTLGIKTFVGAFCSVQVLIVVACLFASDLSVQQSTISTLYDTVHSISSRLEERHLAQTLFDSKSKLHHHLAQISKCAEILANRIRERRFEATQRGETAVDMPDSAFLRSLTIYFDAAFAYFATRENEYMHVERTDIAGAAAAPDFKLATNLFNRAPDNISRHTDTSTLNIELDDDGHPILDRNVTLRVAGYNARTRAFYVETRAAGGPVWVGPWVWLVHQVLGIDACVPVYHESGRGRVDAGAEAAVWNESLAGVACCDNSLSGLSEMLAGLGLGEHGVAFIVESGGANHGRLIAAAHHARVLPVARYALRGTEPHAERLAAADYPPELSGMVAVVSGVLLEEKAWGEMGEEEAKVLVEGVGEIGIRTGVVDGRVPGWEVSGEDGRWSAEEYRMGGQRWVFVIGERLSGRHFELAVDPALADLRTRSIRNYLVCGVLLVVTSAVVSCLSVRPVSLVLRDICSKVEMFRTELQFGSKRRLRSNLVEIQTILEAFGKMQESVLVMAKYVPETVLSPCKQDDFSFHLGELYLEDRECSVLCCGILDFEAAASDQSDEVVVTMIEQHCTAVQAACVKYHGEIIEFNGSRVVVMFASAQHQVRACRTALDLMKKQGHVRGCFGIYSGVFLIGNYGTPTRMKFGVVGSGLDVPRRLCAMASGYGTQTLVDCRTAWAASQVFVAAGHGKVPGTLGVINDDTDGPVAFCSMTVKHARGTRRVLAAAPRPMEVEDTQARPGGEGERSASAGTVNDDDDEGGGGGGGSRAESPTDRVGQWDLSMHGSEEGFEWGSGQVVADTTAESECDDDEEQERGGRRGQCGWFVFRGSALLLLLCVCQLIAAVGVLYAVQIPILAESSRLLNATVHGAANASAPRILEPLVRQSFDLARTELWRMPRCAEMLASELRQRRLSVDDPQRVAVVTHSLVIQYDVAYAYFGTRENAYSAQARQKSAQPGAAPTFRLDSNLYNFLPGNLTGWTDASLISFDVDRMGVPDLASASVAVPGFNPRMRPWYNLTRQHMHPTWVEPYFWLPDLVLGIDACVPVYDESGRGRVDAGAEAEAGAVWNESLAGVACCDNSLSGLSEMLAGLELGEHGVAFIVESGGANHGRLIAAAHHARVLPVARYALRGTETHAERLAAADYPPELSTTLRAVSERLVSGGKRWGELGEASVKGEVEGVGAMQMRTVSIGGAVGGWEVSAEGRWSAEEYTLVGMEWVLAIAIREEDFLSVQPALDRNRRSMQRVSVAVLVVLVALTLASVLLSMLLVRLADRQVRGLRRQMERVQLMRLSAPDELELSVIAEFRDVQAAFEEMRAWLEGLQRFIPRFVIKALAKGPGVQSATDVYESCIREGRLGMSRGWCSVVTILIPKLSKLAQTRRGNRGGGDQSVKVGAWLERIFDVVWAQRGVLDDFDGSSITAFWKGGELHAVMACDAALKVQAVVADLNRSRALAGDNFDCFISVFTGPSLVGNYGTSHRLKYGVSEWTVTRTQKLARVAKTTSVPIIISHSTREAVVGHFLSSYWLTTELGLLYTLKRRVATETVSQAGAESPRSVPIRTKTGSTWIRRLSDGKHRNGSHRNGA